MNSDRAKQFMPFAALRGFGRYIKEQEKMCIPRRELAEDGAAELSEKLKSLKKGMMVSVVYYSGEEYLIKKGMVSAVDFEFKKLTIVKTEIEFEDIYKIET